MARIAIVLLVLISPSLYAQKTKSYTAVQKELSEKIVNAPQTKAPISLAVVPFMATVSSVQNSKAFGEYLTETIIGSLSGHPNRLKLFERTRMDAILKEQEFILTDLMKPAAALKIGQLAPIDAILSGTYTKLKSYVDISARLIDVASGEITVSYSGRIKIDKNLKALFDQVEVPASSGTANTTTVNPTPVQVIVNNTVTTTQPTTVKSKEEVCKELVTQFRPRLNDLTTSEKINNVVHEATGTPFDNQCGKLHFDVMYSFARFKLDPAEYNQFLRKTLDTIAYPTGDERALEIIRYLAADGAVDRGEWNSTLACLTRIGNYWMSNYISYAMAKPGNEPAESNSRIDQYFTLATDGRIGLPRPLSFETCFVEMMEGLKSNEELRQYVYEKYSARLKGDDKLNATLFSELISMYKEESDPGQKTTIIRWLGTFVNTHEYPKAPDQLYDFAKQFALSDYEDRNDEIRKNYPEKDIRLLTELCRNKFAAYATRSQYSSQTEDRINFCVRYQVAVPGVIPTMEEAAPILAGNHLDQQERALKMLRLMGSETSILEPQLIRLLEKKSLEDRDQLQHIQNMAMEVLGNIRTPNQKAIGFMLDALPHYGNDTEIAKEALVKIGKPAVAPIALRLDKTTDQDGGLQYQLISLLGKIGKDATSATKSIKRVLAVTRNADVKYAAEAALQSIEP